MEPLIPFEPVNAASLPDKQNRIAQVKWDGVRMLTYYDGERVQLYNRKRNNRTAQYPELAPFNTYCRAESVILDGELIALADGRPSFHQIMRRDGLRRLEGLEAVQRLVPVTYMVFDLLYCDGVWLTESPLWRRQELLAERLIPGEHVQSVASFPDPEALFRVVQEQGLEGIVVKDRDSTYAIGGKDARWEKVKNYQDLIATVGGVTLRAGTVNALLLGLYDATGRFLYIGHAGTGKLTQEDWRHFTALSATLASETRPFANLPERSKDARWLTPVITVRIRYLEWTHHGTLRQPSIQAFVPTDPRESTFQLAGVNR